MDRKFAGTRAEKISADSDVISKIEQLVEGKAFFANEIQLHVNLQALSALLQVREPGLALQAQRDDASGNLHWNMRIGQLLRGLIVVLGKNLGNGVRGRKFVRISLLAECFNLAQLLLPELVDIFFERQCWLCLVV